jgi:hypothetical protein
MNWIPISERLPDKYKEVIVWTNNGHFYKAYYEGVAINGIPRFTRGGASDLTNVTHWCIPTPPIK